MDRAARVTALLLLAGCLTEPVAPEPAIEGAVAAPGAGNALSALVAARLRNADSVRVRFGTVEAAEPDETTPAVRVEGDSALIPVLGLLPTTDYLLQVVAYGRGGSATGEPLRMRTDTLPSGLPSYVAGGSDPSPGYVVFAAKGYGLAIDNTGRVVWYVHLTDSATLNFQPQQTGRYYTRPIGTGPSDAAPWLEIDPLGRVTRALRCAHGLAPRFHDLIAQTDGSYWIMCDETRTMDLSETGGVTGALVTGTVVQHVSGDGELLFEWSPFEHFRITDLDSASRAGPSVNWTHGNALALDREGGLVVSFRSLSEVTRIDARTGAVIWRMGGLRNQFAFREAAYPFAHQHGVRLGADGELVLLDNLGDPAGSLAVRYAVDPAGRTARLMASYVPTPPTVASLGGSTQLLPNGHTLVAFGNGGRVEEYDSAGRVVWRIEGNAGYVFRATRVRSLYAPGAEDPGGVRLSP